ncbi:MAG: hypothetical protein KBA28_04225 [Syntrophaceae bacterium]|nr:hypothetical protein [Syntrophaceae bacterium]
MPLHPMPNTRQMMIIKGLFIFLLLAFIAASEAVSLEVSPSRVVQADFWKTKWKEKLWMERIDPAPAELLLYLKHQNILDGFPETPTAVTPAREMAEACKDISRSLSPSLNHLLNERLIGIFCVKDLGSSGFAEEVFDENLQKSYAIIVLDRDVFLKRKANEWATWKENSVFQPKKNVLKLRMTIETKKNNTVQNAVRYLLLHELGHTLGLISGVHPSWVPSRRNRAVDYPFMNLSWKNNHQEKAVSLFDDAFPERRKIRYYGFSGAQLTNDQMPAVYRKLQHFTNFVSLQASTNVWEDFAESFVTYVHVFINKKTWQVRIDNDKGGSTLIGPCWQEKRCREKQIFMENWFYNPL